MGRFSTAFICKKIEESIMNAPSEDVKDYLVGVSALALEFATNLFISEMMDEPDECTCIYDTGGTPAEPHITYERPTFQIRVRGVRGEYQDAYDLAQAIKIELNGVNNETIATSRYIGIWLNSDIIFVGYDEKHRPLFSINFRAHRTDA